MAQAVKRSPSTAGVSSSRLGPSMWISWWTKLDLGRFFTGFLPFSPTTNFIPPFLQLISSISIHFIRPCDGASGVVVRHPCYSRTYNMGASSHLIPRPDLVLDTSWGYFLYIKISSKWTRMKKNKWQKYLLHKNKINKYPQLVSNTRSGRGMRCDEAPIL